MSDSLTPVLGSPGKKSHESCQEYGHNKNLPLTLRRSEPSIGASIADVSRLRIVGKSSRPGLAHWRRGRDRGTNHSSQVTIVGTLGTSEQNAVWNLARGRGTDTLGPVLQCVKSELLGTAIAREPQHYRNAGTMALQKKGRTAFEEFSPELRPHDVRSAITFGEPGVGQEPVRLGVLA